MHDSNALGPLLGHCVHLAQARMEARLAQYDVTSAQTHVILYLSHHNGEAPQCELTRFMRVKPSTVNGIVDRMVERGWVSRSVSGTDARQRVIALTEIGKAHLSLFKQSFQEVERVIFTGFSPEERDTLRTLLGRIIHNLEEDRVQC